jgi:hypothetical protein
MEQVNERSDDQGEQPNVEDMELWGSAVNGAVDEPDDDPDE